MQVETIVVGEFESNCFVVSGADSQAIVIDPGSHADRIVACLHRQRLTVCAYLLTHGHMDHVSGLAELCSAMPAPAFCHADDLAWAFTDRNAMLPFYAAPRRPSCELRPLADGQEGTDAGLAWRVIATPGHTPGSVCLYFADGKAVFTGDTLFAGSVGRTDLEGGNPRRLTESLRKLAALPGDTRVYCGHGPDTTIAREKRTNFFLQNLGGAGKA